MHGEKLTMNLHQLMSLINAEITTGLQQEGEQPEHSSKETQLQLGRFICVQIAETEMAINLSSIMEAGELSSIRSLPLLPSWLPGITNIRGNIVSVVDLGDFLGCSQPLSSKTQPFLMVSNESLELAITVERILRTRILYQREHNNPENVGDTPFDPFLSGHAWYKQDENWHSIAWFDLSRFLNSSKLLKISS